MSGVVKSNISLNYTNHTFLNKNILDIIHHNESHFTDIELRQNKSV